jgi:hypothetical protein
MNPGSPIEGVGRDEGVRNSPRHARRHHAAGNNHMQPAVGARPKRPMCADRHQVTTIQRTSTPWQPSIVRDDFVVTFVQTLQAVKTGTEWSS